jgi:hypothetical protein
MKIIRTAAIYARISSGQTGLGLGVQRQLEDCRKLAAERGSSVVDKIRNGAGLSYRTPTGAASKIVMRERGTGLYSADRPLQMGPSII